MEQLSSIWNIISAAHCSLLIAHCQGIAAGNIKSACSNGEQRRKIEEFHPHRKLCPENGCNSQPEMDNDIAILKVDKSFEFNDYVQPACLPTKSFAYKPGSYALVSGFGTIKAGVDKMEDKMEEKGK